MNEIFLRRSVRKFLVKEVEDDKIKLMLDAAMHAPSAKNQQPWHFIVIKDQENIKGLMKMSPGSKALNEAQAVIVFVMDKKAPNFIFIQEDMSAAVQNLMLMGVSLGIGSIWIGSYPNLDRSNFVDKYLEIDEDFQTFALVGIGYPANEDAFHDEKRYDEKRIHHEKW